MCANAQMSFDVTFQKTQMSFDVTLVHVNYVFPRYLLADWWVGGFLPTLLVRSFAPSPLPAQNYYPGIRIMRVSELDGTVSTFLQEDL